MNLIPNIGSHGLLRHIPICLRIPILIFKKYNHLTFISQYTEPSRVLNIRVRDPKFSKLTTCWLLLPHDIWASFSGILVTVSFCWNVCQSSLRYRHVCFTRLSWALTLGPTHVPSLPSHHLDSLRSYNSLQLCVSTSWTHCEAVWRKGHAS